MGLDAIELVMAVEDRFGISIRDEEVTQIVTVGDLTNLVLSRIAAREIHACPTLRAFLALRADVCEVMADDKLRVHPYQKIEHVLPKRRRRVFWEHLEKRLGTIPPSLERPPIVRKLLFLTAIVFLTLGLAPVAVDVDILPLSLLGAAFLSIAVVVLTRPLCVIPPAAIATFGDAARKIAGTTVAMAQSFAPDPDSWVPDVLRDIIAEQLDVDRNIIVPSARFVHDLGMD